MCQLEHNSKYCWKPSCHHFITLNARPLIILHIRTCIKYSALVSDLKQNSEIVVAANKDIERHIAVVVLGILTSGYSLTGTYNFSDNVTIDPAGSGKVSGSLLVFR